MGGFWRLNGIVVNAVPAPALAASTKPAADANVRTVTTQINIRAAPSMDAEKVIILQTGQQLRVLEPNEDKTWYKVAFGKGKTGFAKTSVLETNSK